MRRRRARPRCTACRSAEIAPLSWRAPTLCRALNRWPWPTGLASRAPIRIRGCRRRGPRYTSLHTFLAATGTGPWHDRAAPATSRRVLATRPISLPERSALIAAPRTGTNDAFRHPALTRGAGDATIQHGALGRERQPTRTWRGETMNLQRGGCVRLSQAWHVSRSRLQPSRCNRRSRKPPKK